VIDDLYPTGYGGDLDVIVTEADGSIHTFKVPFAAVPQSLRPGQYKYNVSAGQVRTPNLSSSPAVVQATLQRGLNNTFTGYVGTTVSTGYTSALFGVAANTSIGALGADITFAATDVPGQSRMTGQSARLSYSKLLSATDTNFSLAAYRYSSSGFLSFNDALYVRDRARNPSSTVAPVNRQRHQLQLNVNQSLGRYGSVFATGSVRDYWNSPGSDLQFQVGYSGSYHSLGYSLSATRTKDAYGRSDTQYFAQLSIPLGRGSNMANLSTSMARSGDSTNLQSTLSGSIGTENRIGYGVYGSHATGASTSLGISASMVTNYANLGGSVARAGKNTQSSFNISGGIVAHPGGVTLSQSLGDTFAIVRAKGAQGASVLNAPGVHVNRFGYAVVPYLSPYMNNNIELDPQGTSLNVQLKSTSARVAPFFGAAVMLNFDTEQGRAFIIKAKRRNGDALPFGAEVVDESGAQVGSVGQANRLFVRSNNDNGVLKVRWGKQSSRECVVNYHLPPKGKSTGRVKFEMIQAPCEDLMEADDTRRPEIVSLSSPSAINQSNAQ
jgi:outer membrane usher protein